MFDSTSRGKQCTCIARMATVTAVDKKATDWCEDDMDKILRQGDAVYRTLTIDFEKELVSLLELKVIDSVCVNEHQYNIEYWRTFIRIVIFICHVL